MKTITIEDLSKEAIKTINDFMSDISIIGGNFLKNVESIENGHTIVLTNNFNEKLYYSLSEIGYIFLDNLDYFWEEKDYFFNKINNDNLNQYNLFENLSKEDFIRYVGTTYYIKEKYNSVIEKLYDIGLKTYEL